MPVLLIGVESAAGHATVRRLRRRAGEVRVYLDAERSGEHDAERYRRMGCKVALGTLDDEGHLETAMEQAHSIVHVGANPLEDPGAQLDALATVAAAAIGAGVSRFLWATELAADEPGDNPYLAALSEAAGIVATLPMETIVFRCGLRYGPQDAFTRALAGAAGGVFDSDARHAPLYADDLAAALVTADDQRGSGSDVRLDVELVGPEELQLDAFVTRLRQAVGADAAQDTLPAWIGDWLSRDATGGADALGRQGTPVSAGLAEIAGTPRN